MSHPFIIWTFQRTGGTTLSVALSNAGKNQDVKHEPFNRDREFAFVGEAVRKNNLTKGALLLDEVLDAETNIKHCFELHSRKFNRLFLDRVSKHKHYRHIVLMRNAEANRLCSLFLAKQTTVWGKWKADKGGYDDILSGNEMLEPFPIDEMLQHYKRCSDYKTWLMHELKKRKMNIKEITFEDLYSGPLEDRLQNTKDLFDFIDSVYDENKNEISNEILSGGQKSERLFSFVPNFEEAMQTLNHAITKSSIKT